MKEICVKEISDLPDAATMDRSALVDSFCALLGKIVQDKTGYTVRFREKKGITLVNFSIAKAVLERRRYP